MNKYITKIATAGLVYPQLKKTEFDLAFEGDANPIRDRILNYLDRKDREKRNAKEYQLQQKIETDREFFIQNCNTIDSVEAREECLRNIPN